MSWEYGHLNSQENNLEIMFAKKIITDVNCSLIVCQTLAQHCICLMSFKPAHSPGRCKWKDLSFVSLNNLSKVTWLIAVGIGTGIRVCQASNAPLLELSHYALCHYVKMEPFVLWHMTKLESDIVVFKKAYFIFVLGRFARFAEKWISNGKQETETKVKEPGGTACAIRVQIWTECFLQV